MKKRKLLILIILILTITTGCSIEYNITINKDTIKEEIIVDDIITTTRSKEKILEHYNKWYPTYVNYMKTEEKIPLKNFNKKYQGIEYYNKSIKEINNGYQYKYFYTHNIDDYYDGYALANTFEDVTIQETEKTLVLKTSAESFFCNYDYFDSIKVNVTFNPKNYQINYTNAINVENNTYTWTINKSNCNTSQMILTLNKIINTDSSEDNIKQDYSMYMFYGILLGIVIIGYFIIKKQKSKLNDFDIDD